MQHFLLLISEKKFFFYPFIFPSSLRLTQKYNCTALSFFLGRCFVSQKNEHPEKVPSIAKILFVLKAQKAKPGIFFAHEILHLFASEEFVSTENKKLFQMFSQSWMKKKEENETFTRSHQCFKQFSVSAFPSLRKSTHINPEIYFEHMCCCHTSSVTYLSVEMLYWDFHKQHIFCSFIFGVEKKFSKIRISNQLGIFSCCLIRGP